MLQFFIQRDANTSTEIKKSFSGRRKLFKKRDCLVYVRFQQCDIIFFVGGPLSSLLCNFYLGEVDLKYLTEFGNDSSGFLVRNCDDYLYVTLDEEKARTFLNRLTAGFPDYNLRLNNDKTESNITNKTANLVKISSFELDVSSFQIYRCFQLYKNRSIFHTLSFKTTKSPGK